MVGNVDSRIDGVNKGVHSVFCTAEVIWKLDVALINGVIPNLSMSNLQLLSCKVGLFFNISVKLHVLLKVKNCNVALEDGPLYTGSHNLSSGTLENHWQDLLKVPSKNNGKSTKRPVTVVQVSKRAINSLYDMVMLHGCFIPNNQVSIID